MFTRMRKMGFGLLVLGSGFTAIFVALASTALAAAPVNVRGTYEGGACVSGSIPACEAHDEYPQSFTISTENFETGEITGSGVAGSDTWTVTGTITGTTLVLHDRNFTTAPGYSSDATLTVSAEGGVLQGTFTDSMGRSNAPTFAKRVSKGESAAEEAARKAKEEAEKVLRPTSTSVVCDYEFATSENTCVASVGDGGSGSPVTPTGTVTFTTTSGGFGNGAQCALTPTPLSPQVSSCTLIYETANSGLPSITATYGGDARHAGSVGHTQFLGAGPEEIPAETPPGSPGQYPNEVILEPVVPINGTTVEGVVQPTDADPAPVPMGLPKIDPSLDPISAADLSFTDKVAEIVNDSGAQKPKPVQELMESIAKDTMRADELIKSGNPAEVLKGQALMNQTNETLEAINKMLKQQEEIQKQIIKNAKSSAFSSARHKTAKKQKTKVIKPLAYVVRPKAAAGKLKLKLPLNRAALNKLAGKRNSLIVYVRVDMVLPSMLYKGGLPRSFVERITLKRTPAAKGHKPHKKH